jgi:imidazoleglycerol phosphate synthase glutamine amidotransferase subunit HisH
LLSVVVHCNSINRRASQFHLTSITVPSVWPLLSIDVHSLLFNPINTLYLSNRMYYVHTYPIPYFSNRIYVFFKIVYRFFLINMYIYIVSY